MPEKKPSKPPSRRPSAAKRPPPLPRRETIEVEASWLEEGPASEPAKGARRASTGAHQAIDPKGAPRRETMEVHLEWLEDVPEEPKPAEPAPKRARSRWEPPTLPPPPATAARARRAMPPPLPREDPIETPRRSSKPPKR